MDEVRLLRLAAVAELLSISKTKAYELVASGEIPSVRLGRSVRVPLKALREWVLEQTSKPPVSPFIPPVPTPTVTTRRARPSPVASPAPRARRTSAAKAKPEPTEVTPFFEPWMPRPMDKAEYHAWIKQLDEHPNEKARVLEAAERHWYGGRRHLTDDQRP